MTERPHLYEVDINGHKRQFRLLAAEAARLGATLVKKRVIRPDNPPNNGKKQAKE